MATFLRNLVSRVRPGDGQLSVAAFGKHPAWGDHLPDIGLAGPLVDAKQALYLDGIRDKAISYWKTVDPTQLIEFEHDLLWQRPDALIVGRLWHSSDGASPPRRDFPMVLMADCTGLPLAWALKKVLPRLAKAEVACKATPSGDQVREIVLTTQEELRQLVAEQRPTEESSGGLSPEAAVAELADLPDFGPEYRGLQRVFYVLADVDLTVREDHPRAEQIRVPRAYIPSAAALELWRKAIVAKFGPRVETLIVVPRSHDWVDVLIGKPDPGQFNILRASPALIPCTTEIGYSLSPAFVAETEKFILDCYTAAGKVPQPAYVEPMPGDEAAPPVPERTDHNGPASAVVVQSDAEFSEGNPTGESLPGSAATQATPLEAMPLVPEPASLVAEVPKAGLPAVTIPTVQPTGPEASAEPARPLLSALAPPLRPASAASPSLESVANPVTTRTPPVSDVALTPAAQTSTTNTAAIPVPATKPPSLRDPATTPTAAPVAAPRLGPTIASSPAAAIPSPARSSAMTDAPLKQKRSLKLLAVVAVLLVLLGAGLLLLPTLLKSARPAGEDWVVLCEEYSTWFADFASTLDNPTNEKRYTADPDLKKVIEPILMARANNVPLDPRVILSRPGMDYKVLGEKALEKQQPPDVVEKGQHANELIAQVKHGLSAEQWPLLRDAQDLRKYFADVPTGAGQMLAAMTDDINCGPHNCLTQGIDELLNNANAIRKIRSCLATLAAAKPSFEASGDPALKTLARDAEVDLKAAARKDINALSAEAVALDNEVTEVSRVLKEEWKSTVNREEFIKRAIVPSTATYVQRLREWRTAVAGYKQIPPTGALRETAAHDRQLLAETESAIGEIRSKSAKIADTLEAELASAKQLTAQLVVPDLLEKDRSALEETAKLSSRTASTLHQKVLHLREKAGQDDRQYLAQLRNSDEWIKDSPVLSARWRAERDALIASKLPVMEIAPKIEALQKSLTALDAELAEAFSSQPALPARPWAEDLRTKATAAKRNLLLNEALKDGDWHHGPDAVLSARLADARKQFVQWQNQVTEAAAQAAIIEDRLNDLYSIAAVPQTEDKPTGELCKAMLAAPVLREPEVASAMQPVVQRAESLLALAADIPTTLERAKSSTDPAVLLAAWSRLVSLPLKENRALEQQLIQSLSQSKSPRAATVTEEVRREAARRWAEQMAGSQPAEIEQAVAAFREEDFPGPHPRLSPRAQFNLWIYTAKRLSPIDEEKALLAVISLESNLAEAVSLASEKPVMELRKQLADLQSHVATANAATGPSIAGWTRTAEKEVDGEKVITFELTGKANRTTPRLQFALVPGKGKIAPFYLGTTEVSFQQLRDIVTAGGRWEIFSALAPVDPQRQNGPRLWTGGPTITRSNTWFPAGAVGQNRYPDALQAPAEAGRDVTERLQGGDDKNPTDSHPMQYLSPGAAIYVAGVAGCRLPLAEEWKLAYERFEVAKTDGASRSLPNLRDALWTQERDWLKAKGKEKLATADAFSPTLDAVTKDPYKALPTDDGYLYFAPVEADTGRVVHHLVGNVAELVIGGDQPPPVARTGTDQEIWDYLSKLKSAPGRWLMVIGGSALSNPNLPLDQPVALPPNPPRGGYCDVGFRLAFTAPQESLKTRWADTIAAAAYLTSEPIAQTSPGK